MTLEEALRSRGMAVATCGEYKAGVTDSSTGKSYTLNVGRGNLSHPFYARNFRSLPRLLQEAERLMHCEGDLDWEVVDE